MRFTKPVCTNCGSDDVRADAFAAWDPVTQDWVITATFDTFLCEGRCGEECNVKEVPLEGDALNEARAYRLAKDNGWSEGDEDTAIEFCSMERLAYESPIEGEDITQPAA